MLNKHVRFFYSYDWAELFRVSQLQRVMSQKKFTLPPGFVAFLALACAEFSWRNDPVKY